MTGPDLAIPHHLSDARRRGLLDLAARNDAAHGSDFLGLVLGGSAGRGYETERSDVDVYVVLTDAGMDGRDTTRSPDVDEIPIPLSELEVPEFGSEGWWFRWAFAWTPVLLDRTDGRLSDAVRRQATVAPDEALRILVDHDRLDGWLNFAYRALKNDRDGRLVERRLDACESVPWLLDTVFTLAGRVRPYNKYLPWELAAHPLPDWDDGELLGLVTATLDGDPAGIRATYRKVRLLCDTPALRAVIDDWGTELEHFVS